MAEVLVIDDDPVTRSVVRYVLEHAGHTVRETADGQSASLPVTGIGLIWLSPIFLCR
jgi:CheY-like chemotaxis protein